MAGSEWEFISASDKVWLVHNCPNNPKRLKESPGQNYAWTDLADEWRNKNLHCYVCNAEPPEDIRTQAYLIPVKGLNSNV